MTEETWILEQCRRPKGYGTLGEKSDTESGQSFFKYVVGPSDTLTSIAVKNEVSIGQIKHLNRMLLSGDKNIIPGTVLRIPAKQTVAASPPNSVISENITSKASSLLQETEQRHLLMLDPLVQTITSSSQSMYCEHCSSSVKSCPHESCRL